MQFTRNRAPGDVDVNLTPLIDVVFLLLIFFMVTTTFQVTSGIKVDLPDSSAQMPDRDVRRIVVSIRTNGDMFLDRERVTAQSLRAALAERASKNPDALVVIRADKGVIHGRVVDVMDAARTAGLTKMAIATTLREQ